jgi:hypothetical protein
LKGLAAMDTYSPRLTTSQVRQAHEQKYNYLLTLYQGQQATRAVYNKLLATIWEKSAKTAQESTPMKSAKRD